MNDGSTRMRQEKSGQTAKVVETIETAINSRTEKVGWGWHRGVDIH